MNSRAIAVPSLRVAAYAALTAASTYAALAYRDVGSAPVVAVRALLLAGAVAVLATAGGATRARRGNAVVGVGLDVGAVLLGGGWLLSVPAGTGCALIGVGSAEVAFAAAVLAVAVADLAARWSPDRSALRAAGARRARVAAKRERLRRVLGAVREAQARAELLAQLVVHDLRNPLTVVIAHLNEVQAELAGSPGLANEIQSLAVATGEALRLSRMIGDLLLVPRLERGELAAQFAAVSVREVLDVVARATRPQASARQVRVEVVAPPALVAWLDADLVRRMIENLVSNALRYTPASGRIELAAHADGERLRLAVRNSGPPIPVATRARLFEKYATHGPGRQNNGLGLFLCRLVSEIHGGRIGLVEHAGWNVSFEADLPLAGRGHPGDDVAARGVDGPGPASPHHATARPSRGST